jgi:WD40 repeat protein
LVCKKEVKVQKILTVMKFLVFRVKKEVDLLIGTGSGELLVNVDGKLLVHIDGAHEGAVLCISTSETGTGLVFTGGDDGVVRIWTHSLLPVNKFSMHSLTDPILVHSKQHSISNIQIYTCFSKKPLDSTLPKGAKLEPLVLAIGTTSGALVEVSLSNVMSSEQITLQFKVHFENHCLGTSLMAKTLFAIHPEFPVLASISDDKILKLWQFETMTCLFSKELDSLCKPCFIVFSPSGNLAIGMDNGVVLLLASKDSAWGSSSRVDLDLVVISTIRENNSAIICIKFSQDAEYLAVSYNNMKGLSRFQESSGVKTSGVDVSSSFVVLLQMQDTGNYKRISKISFPFGSIKDIASYPPRNECAACGIEFSDDSMFITLIHQKVTSSHLPGIF